jgi:hypothetical protein
MNLNSAPFSMKRIFRMCNLNLVLPFVMMLLFLCNPCLRAQVNPANNSLGLDVSTFAENASFNYDSCFAVGQNLGMGSVGLFRNWTGIETAPNTFDLAIFDIANYYYPLYNMAVDLTITPIHTNNLEVPADLTTTAFNDPLLINRFKTLLDSVKAHLPNLTLSSLVIGSEQDVYLGGNATLWSHYTTFYDSVSAHARSLWPGLKIATELTFNGITNYNTYAQVLNTNSDYIGVSYYPINVDFTVQPVSVIATDFTNLVGLYPSKPLCFYQYGYPSSTVCNSSENLQAQFIAETFSAWDNHAANIRYIDFTWLHDLDTADVNFYGSYYGINDPVFLEFLRSLGLRTWNGSGTHKLAMIELECQARQRGFNNVNTNCTTGQYTPDGHKQASMQVYPNPAQERLTIQLTNELKSVRVELYNAMGQLEREVSFLDANRLQIETSDFMDGAYFEVDISCWPKGMYFYSVLDKEQKVLHSGKFIKN